ncbi:MAG TPA: hypothetical protein VFQ35_20160 [Polyangiaceae bacterium]|nr:hypothetical protein [Polyangiaceae bacterium]
MSLSLRSARAGQVVAWVVFASGAVLACNKDRPASVEAPTSGGVPSATPEPVAAAPAAAQASAAEPAAAAPSEPSAASARVDEANFSISITPSGAYAAGKPAEAQIVLDAKPPFHVNDKYPYKFKLKDAAGLTFANPVVGKDNVKLETQRATMTVPFTVKDPGKHTLAGQFSFSVCTEDKCLMEKRDLALSLEAK